MSFTEKSVLLVGAGGLGGSALLGLAAAGLGRLVVRDGGAVETAHLPSQPLCGEAGVGKERSEVVERRLRLSHPGVRVELLRGRFDAGDALQAAQGCDVVLSAAGDFDTQFLVNDAALAAQRPLVHGGVLRHTAQLLSVIPGRTGCLRCLFEGPPSPGAVPGPERVGVLGPLAGFAGALMAQEALRLLAGERGAYSGQLLVYEARPAWHRFVPVRQREGCPACAGARPPEHPLPGPLMAGRAGGESRWP